MKHRRKFSVADGLNIALIIATIIVIIWAVYRLNARYQRDEMIALDESIIAVEEITEAAEPTVEVESTSSAVVETFILRRPYSLMYEHLHDLPIVHLSIEVESETAVETEVEIEFEEEAEMYAAPMLEGGNRRYVSVDTVDIIFTQEGVKMLASLVTLEVGAESYECQQAVASVVINRMIIENKSLHDVVYQTNLFSVAPYVESTEPFNQCIDAVLDVIQNGTTIPRYVTYFRADCYHDWGDRYVSWRRIDKTYFTYDTKLKAIWE